MHQLDTVDDARILVVDDEESVIRVMQIFLKGEGYTNVATTTRARFALPLLAELGVDLLVLDLHMPYLTGFEIFDQLKDRVPTVIITADPSPEVMQRALDAGVEVVPKPFQVRELLERIKSMLLARQEDGAVADTGPGSEGQASSR